MPFKTVIDSMTEEEMEVFEGKVDFVSVKELDNPDNYGNTHRVSIAVDSDAQGKNGTWISWGSYKEDRIRGNGRAVSVQSKGEWYDMCKGYVIKVQVKRNNTFINPVIKSLIVKEKVDLPQAGGAQGGGQAAQTASRGQTSVKRDNTGMQTGHGALGGARFFAANGGDLEDNMKTIHNVTARVIAAYTNTNQEGLNEFECGMAGGNAVNAALYLVDSLDNLEAKAIELLNGPIANLRAYIKAGGEKGEQVASQAATQTDLKGASSTQAF